MVVSEQSMPLQELQEFEARMTGKAQEPIADVRVSTTKNALTGFEMEEIDEKTLMPSQMRLRAQTTVPRRLTLT